MPHTTRVYIPRHRQPKPWRADPEILEGRSIRKRPASDGDAGLFSFLERRWGIVEWFLALIAVVLYVLFVLAAIWGVGSDDSPYLGGPGAHWQQDNLTDPR